MLSGQLPPLLTTTLAVWGPGPGSETPSGGRASRHTLSFPEASTNSHEYHRDLSAPRAPGVSLWGWKEMCQSSHPRERCLDRRGGWAVDEAVSPAFPTAAWVRDRDGAHLFGSQASGLGGAAGSRIHPGPSLLSRNPDHLEGRPVRQHVDLWSWGLG